LNQLNRNPAIVDDGNKEAVNGLIGAKQKRFPFDGLPEAFDFEGNMRERLD
jgi:hypothetical protein